MRRENPFNRKRVKKEIDNLIDEVNKSSIAKELKNQKNNIPLYKCISLNSKTIVNLSKLLQGVNDNVHIHTSIFIKIGKAMKKMRKFLIFSIGLSVINFILLIWLLLRFSS